MKVIVKKRMVSRKKSSKGVTRAKNGQIIKGSSSLKGSGRPKGARSTGKKIKSVKKSKTSVSSKRRKTAGSVKNPNKLATKQHTSTGKRKAKDISGVKRNSKGQLQRGSAGIGGGRHAGNSSIDELNCAIAQAEREKGKNADWLVDLIKRSWKDTTLAVAILSRKFAALKSIEQVTLPADVYTPEEIKDMRKEYRERFG